MKFKHILVVLGLCLAVTACGSNRKDDANANSSSTVGRPGPNSSWSDFTNASRNGYADRVFFDYDSHEVRPDQVATLQAWADWLKAHGGAQIMIEGHCDERGTREYNLGLGAKRATSVKNYLVSLGIPANRVRTVSFGQERPAEAGSDEASWAKNRRGVGVPSGSGA
jgi:peptidoglycan-associated lipoprotein